MHEQPPRVDEPRENFENNIIKKLDHLKFPEKIVSPINLRDPKIKETKANIEKIDTLSEPEMPEGDESQG